MTVPNRSASSTAYRYGFQGQEKDDEIKGEGNSLNYKFRMHDPRVGRFFAVDPLFKQYPHYTPYSFSGNKVIAFVEREGQEEKWFLYNQLAEHATGKKQPDVNDISDAQNKVIKEIFFDPAIDYGNKAVNLGLGYGAIVYNGVRLVPSTAFPGVFEEPDGTGYYDVKTLQTNGIVPLYTVEQELKESAVGFATDGVISIASGGLLTEAGPVIQGVAKSKIAKQVVKKMDDVAVTISKSTDDIIASASRIKKGKTRRGVQALDKKIGRGDTAYQGLKANQESVNKVIKEVMDSPKKSITPTRNQQGIEVIDIINPDTKQGVRLIKETEEFDTFING